MTSKLLIVDDDKNICEILEYNLKNEGYDVACAYSAEEALQNQIENYSLILLDVMMGGMSGFKLAEQLRLSGVRTPIIFLTAKDTENDMLTGFSVGGDDYISKPFSVKELIARVRAVLKRSNTLPLAASDGNKLVFNDFVIDLEVMEISIKNEKISLTRKEFEIIALLAEFPEKVFSRDDIIDRLWKDTPYVTVRTVDVHITRLRKKLGDYAGIITNRSGFGYRFNASFV